MGFEKLKKFILENTPKKIINFYLEPINKENRRMNTFSTLSYSQEGEDLILKRIFEGQKTGFYVDVGAHHPKRFSNTYLFYKLGWRGINIDAMPGSMDNFKAVRPEDINLEVAVSDIKGIIRYYIFNEPALNTFSDGEARRKDGKGNYKIVDEIYLPTVPLSEILQKYWSGDKQIDFLNIDVEGLDFKVLKSVNWTLHRPKIILVEDLANDLENLEQSEIFIFLKNKNYTLFAKTFNTLIFQRQK